MSSLVQLPAITAAYSPKESIAIFTANSKTLTPMNGLIKEQCGVSPEEDRFVIVGCQDIPGFEAVAIGAKVDVAKVTPGIVALAKQVLAQNPTIRAILLECTELPPYSDALRHATGLPVYDAITCANMFIDGLVGKG
jgi:Asp/Glu/hydantoin racemase